MNEVIATVPDLTTWAYCALSVTALVVGRMSRIREWVLLSLAGTLLILGFALWAGM